jgi:predicted metallo-beta-lactamase superfamily hydrolase
MCVCIETPDVTVTVDPGAALEPGHFPLPIERRHALLEDQQTRIRTACARSSLIVISHYHLDHFTDQRDAGSYGGKTLFVKSPDDLPARQLETARSFHKTIDGLPKETIVADGRKFKFKKTQIRFSPPVWHGAEDAEPGRVIMTEVTWGKDRVLVSSDVGGPLTRETTDLIVGAKAHTVILDGYPTYLLGQFATDFDLVRSITNVCRILATPAVKTLVLDHHMARDYRYPAFYKLAYDKAKALGKTFGTAAEVLGRTSMVLEGFQNYGPTRWQKWAPLVRADARKVLERARDEGRLSPDWLDAFDRWVV